MSNSSWLGFVALVSASACGDNSPPPIPPPPPATATKMIDEMGGTVTVGSGDLTITIPPNSVDGATRITIEESIAARPADAQGPVYEFRPAGLVFAHPVTITLALPEGVTSGDIYWSRAGGAPGFDNVGGVSNGSSVTSEVVHFSDGYVGAAAPTRTVTGSQQISWVSASSFVLRPVDLSAFQAAALVENGSGGYTTITGTGNADGTFVIPNVPDGPYWLRVPGTGADSWYYRTSANAVDAGYTKRGRPDAVALTQPTPITLTISNLESWQDDDAIEVFSSESNSWYFDLQAFSSAGGPIAGDTALTGFEFDSALDYATVPSQIDGLRAPPDRVVVAQLSSRLSGSVPYKAMSRVFEPAPFSTATGVPTTLTGAFADVAGNNTISIDLRSSAISAALTEESRPCTPPANWPIGWLTSVLGVPGGLEHGITGSTADFLLLDTEPFGADLVVNMSFGMPIQGTWSVYGYAQFGEPCTFLPPNALAPIRVGGNGLTYTETLARFGSGPLDVRLGQVRAPRIANQSLFTATSVGLTPTISWTAPSVGTPTFYEVAVVRVFADQAGNGRQQAVAKLTTDQLSLTLPSGILTSGDTYVMIIRARVSSRSDSSAFNREALPEYTASVTSGMIVP